MGLRHKRLTKRQSPQTNGVHNWCAPTVGAAAAMCGVFGSVIPIVLTGSAATMLAVAAHADTAVATPDADKLVSLDVTGADLAVVISALRAQAGVQIVVREDPAQPFGKVNIMMKRAPLSSVLKYIALSANASLTKDDSGVYVLQPVTSAVTSPALTQASLVDPSTSSNTISTPDLPRPKPNEHWQKIVLKYEVPSHVLRLLRIGGDDADLTNSNIELGGPPRVSAIAQGVQILTTTPQQASVPIGTNGSDNGTVNFAPDGTPGNEAHQFFPGGGGGGGFNGGGGGGRGGFGGGRGGFGGNQAGGAFGGQQQQVNLLPEGVENLIALQADNSILVNATPEGYSELRKLIGQIDVRAKQVEIKVQFITAAVEDIETLSANFSLIPLPGVSLASNLGTPSVSTLSLQYAAGNAAVALQAGLRKTHSKTVQAPLITTTNNTQGSVAVVQQVFFNTSTTVIGNGTNPTITNNTPQALNLRTSLTVTPRINGDNSVTLNLFPQVNTISGPAVGNNPPPSITEFVQTLRTVHNNETMVLGGLVTKDDVRGTEGIPFLSKLPLIGSLFRNKNVSRNDTELLIFVTPHVIEDDDSVNGPVVAGGTSVTP